MMSAFRTKLWLFVIVTFVLLSHRSLCQPKFNHYSTKDGLLHTHVLCVYQDTNGMIWIGTFGGLHRFDGYSFKVFKSDPKDPTSLSNNAVNVVYEDKTGQLWIGTEGGLNRFDQLTETFTQYIHDPNDHRTIGHNTIKTIYEDKSGLLWIGTYGGGLNSLDPSKGQIERFNSKRMKIPNEEFDKINAIFPKSEHQFWIGTEKGGLFYFDPINQKITEQYPKLNPKNPKNSLITDIIQHSNGTIYLGTWNEGLYRFDPIKNEFELVNYSQSIQNQPSLKNIRTIEEDRKGNLWLAHFGSGLGRLNIKTGKYERYFYIRGESSTLSNDYTWSLTVDKADNLWVGTFGGGLNRLSPNRFAIPLIEIPGQGNEKNNNVKAVLESRRGEIWLGTFSSGLFLYDMYKKEFKNFFLPGSSASHSILTLLEDSHDKIWIGTDFGLFNVDSTRTVVQQYANDLQRDKSIVDAPIFNIIEDGNDNLWIGTWNQGLQLLDTKNANLANSQNAEFIQFKNDPSDPASISNDIINALYLDKENQLWIGTSSFIDKMDLKSHHFSRVKEMIASSFFEDDQHQMWVATLSDGLYCMDKKGKVLQSFDGIRDASQSSITHLQDPVLLSMHENGNKNIWITTNSGLSQLNLANKLFSHYSLADLGQSALSINSIEVLSNGSLLLGGMDGFNIFAPDSLQNTPKAEKVFITDIKINRKSIFIKSDTASNFSSINLNQKPSIELNQKDKSLTLNFATLEFANPEKINFAYKLEGFEKGWNYTSASYRQAAYTNLPPGNYTFWLKVTNAQGEWGEEVNSLEIIVIPPYWSTWWFIMLMLIAIISMVALIFKLRTRQLVIQKKRLQGLVDLKTAELHFKSDQLQQQNLELQEQKEEIVRITDEIKEANENKIRFFTSVSHEFRTPLTLVLGPIEQLKKRLSEDQKSVQFLSIIEKNGYRLLRLVNDILDFRKMNTQNMQIICVEADVMMFLNQLSKAFEETADKKGVTIEFSAKPDGLKTWFDPGKLEIICYNLLANALHFTPKGGTVRLIVSINEESEIWQIQVEDTGIGMQEKELTKVFSRFYQVEDVLQNAKGSGIGLSLTKEMTELMGGEILVESTPSVGTTFTIKLPLISPSKNQGIKNLIFKEEAQPEPDFNLASQFIQEPVDQVINGQSSETTSLNKETILIVEDNKDMSQYLVSCLEETYQIILAFNGEEGLEQARQLQPQLIISDIMMPKMDGLQMCKKIKEDFEISHIPVILLSAQTAYETQLEGFGSGADAFIPKPFNQKFLLTRIEGILQSRKNLHNRFKDQVKLEPTEITVTSVDEIFVRNAKLLVEAHISESEFGVNDLIRELGMSRTLLHMKFKKLTNCSTSEFIKTLRMKRAGQLLLSSNYRVSEICYEVGYTDPHNFSKTFKQYFGLTPSEYKIQLKDADR